ncbi:ABC-F family ATP-binding cassette domain-containing protein [Franconibacter helveticus]|uniref:ABC-F family ATP-binding cassette domain-containing protein n=1 Tax=Franconibacter helveticus TaxID=357240 RepID=UPI000DA189A6|nr:ABC-F family ATP-binding cassette domain-containing protein [Franconibacter helveticus]
MSTLLSVHSVGYDNAFGTLLHDISFAIKKGDRIGLIGHNGSGKSTLLKILSGELAASRGSVTASRASLLARVEQSLPDALYHCSLLEALLARLPPSQREAGRWRCEALLASLGFSAEQGAHTAGTLSGGQHTRLLLARALIMQPDLLLLDEPSNHLDLPTLLWLENFLNRWGGSVVLVSHDSRLLDSVTNGTLILRDKTLQFFRLPCTAARRTLAAQDEADAQRHQAEQKEIERIEKSARRMALWGRDYDNEGLARKAQQMEKRADWLKETQTRLTEGSRWRLQLQGETLEADRLLALSRLEVRPAADAPALFSLEQLQVKSGDRVAIVGRNGAGKSSLLQHLWRAWQAQEQGLFHPRLRIGYYDQSQRQLHDDETLTEALARFSTADDEQRKRALISAGFPYARHQQRVSVLSGGERSRLLFVGLTLGRYSLLLLDEPTNHLDMEGKEELEATLRGFSGAVLLVTHDRSLIEQSCNRFWLIDDRRLSEWHDLAAVYERLAGEQGVAAALTAGADVRPAAMPEDEESLLAALLSLEQKLQEDKARKPKHQKPALQAHWQAQIEALSARLNLS